MDREPEPLASREVIQWIGFERDAEWTAELAILRAASVEVIDHFGECRREHQRHAEELAELAREVVPEAQAPTGPAFLTRDAFLIGAIDDGAALVDAMERVELARIGRYYRRRSAAMTPVGRLDKLLERHLADARRRLATLQRLRPAIRASASHP